VNVPESVSRRQAQIMAERAIGKHVPAKDLEALDKADKTVGNEDQYRGLPLFPPDGRMPRGCTMTGTRPGDSTRHLEDAVTRMEIRHTTRSGK
jgi:hypothetical protein